ncbi:hypothetical protein F8388_008706 [Cannabis sativa]|uniref:Zinc knuckle CX2CX4HX4C domain-containing protein n=1 Tax=Cannabis sativa TaxID=3483 RepID=A0A7J6HK29_CANSA|nr:hypothetical protein F8388_008706 [Cannabis sativa]
MKSLKLAKMIGDEVGDFLEVDKSTILQVSGFFLRVRVLIDVSKPVTRGIMVDFKNIHREKWLNFKYENLPNICFHCGMFDHTLTKCMTYLQMCDNHAYPPPLPYKIPLKAPAKTNFKRNPFDLTNSIPYDELNLPHYNLDQSLTAAVNQFLSTEDIRAGSSVSTPLSCTLEGGSIGHGSNPPTPFEGQPHSHSVLNASAGYSEAPSRVLCDMPISTMSSVAITANEEGLHAAPYVDHISRLSEKAQGKVVAGAKRAAFTPHYHLFL